MQTSQFGEGRIIADLLADYPIPRTSIEFGAYDGTTNSNTYPLWHDHGFRSLLIEPDEGNFNKLQQVTQGQEAVTILKEFVTLENSLQSILSRVGFADEIGVLSIDIDANDLDIFEAFDHTRTHIVIIEFNQQLPYWCDYRDPEGQITFRHSAAATARVARSLGYGVVACIGCNLVLLNGRYHNLKQEWMEPDLNRIFDHAEHKRACGDIRIIGCKFTTNAKVFTQKPSALLRLKAKFKQCLLVRNYRRRGKAVPPSDISKDCQKALVAAGLYL